MLIGQKFVKPHAEQSHADNIDNLFWVFDPRKKTNPLFPWLTYCN